MLSEESDDDFYDSYNVEPLCDDHLLEKIRDVNRNKQHSHECALPTLADLAIMELVRQRVLPLHEAQKQAEAEHLAQREEVMRLRRAHAKERKHMQRRMREMDAEVAAAVSKRTALELRDATLEDQTTEGIAAAFWHYLSMPSEQEATRLQSFTEWLNGACYEDLVNISRPLATIMRACEKDRVASTYGGWRQTQPTYGMDSPASSASLPAGEMKSLDCPVCGSRLALAMDDSRAKVGLVCSASACVAHNMVLHTSAQLELTDCCADMDDEACTMWQRSPHRYPDPRFRNIARRPHQRGCDGMNACASILVIQSPPKLASATRQDRSMSLGQDLLGYHACSSCTYQLDGSEHGTEHGTKRARRASSKSKQCMQQRTFRALACCQKAGCPNGLRFRGGHLSIVRALWCDDGGYGTPSSYRLSECAHCHRSVCKDHVSVTRHRQQRPSVENGFQRREYLHFCVDCTKHVHGDASGDDSDY